jgi:hypothetical protein
MHRTTPGDVARSQRTGSLPENAVAAERHGEARTREAEPGANAVDGLSRAR